MHPPYKTLGKEQYRAYQKQVQRAWGRKENGLFEEEEKSQSCGSKVDEARIVV